MEGAGSWSRLAGIYALHELECDVSKVKIRWVTELWTMIVTAGSSYLHVIRLSEVA